MTGIPVRNVSPELAQRYADQGWWTRDTLGDLLARSLKDNPHVTFRVHSAQRPYAGTFADVELLARKLAAGLRARGVGAGDVVAFQLPNWVEAAATFWASAFLGAVVVPIVHFYGPREVGFILGTVQPRAFITAEQFGRMAFDPDVCSGVPIVALVGSSFDALVDIEPMEGTLAADPAGPTLIAFTSGTTSNPKGVIHSHQTLSFETHQLLANYPPDRGRQLTALPVGHFIGMLGAFLIPVIEGAPIDLCDVWDPDKAIDLMETDGVSLGGGPPYFVTSLLDHPRFTAEHLRYIKHIGLGGATVPAAVTRRLADHGILVTRSYGSSEHPSITGSHHTAPEDKRLYTDGDARPGVEIRLADDGEILSRGPDLFIGYTDPALTAQAFDDEGWYHTGDIGVMDDDGYVTITDRKSDIIIRGGENISALEVEEILLALPAVAEAVVVSAPDSRLGERAAAVLRIKSGHAMPTLSEVREHFERAGVAKQKWPEELHAVDDYPRTASGKVQKYVVRQRIREQAEKSR
ncbi:AMP-binding protein [Mycobacterium sp.]|uniref:AMP-binding protein n=1 Tax=Mycobacterium sp. TaxID=1785 RepID=UPI003F9A335B